LRSLHSQRCSTKPAAMFMDSKPSLLSQDNVAGDHMKLLFTSVVLLLYPCIMCILLDADATMRYWFGHTLLWAVVLLAIWLVICSFAASRLAIRKQHAALFFIIIPAAVLCVTCQIEAWQLKSQATALVSSDCMSFSTKARLEQAYTTASSLFLNCTMELANATGASMTESRRVASFNECPGFVDGMRIFPREWWYLSHLEKNYDCSGWCSPQPGVWETTPKFEDSCSVAVARTMDGSFSTMIMQITVYSLLIIVVACVAVLFCPSYIQA